MANSGEREAIKLTPEGEVQCFRDLRSQVIKLLYMIEAESRGEQDISLWFYGFVYELASSNVLCGEKLTKVLVKIHGLYDGDKYKTMTHDKASDHGMQGNSGWPHRRFPQASRQPRLFPRGRKIRHEASEVCDGQ